MRLQYHLITLLVCLFVSGFILFLNCAPRKDASYAILAVFDFGWPVTFLKQNRTQGGDLFRWSISGVICDLFTMIGFNAIAVLSVETIIRRQKINVVSQFMEIIMKHRLSICIILFVIASVIIMFGAERKYVIDLNSARALKIDSMFGISILERRCDTNLVQFLKYNSKVALWQTDSSYTIISKISPHYQYHGSMSRCDFSAKIIKETSRNGAEAEQFAQTALKFIRELKDAELEEFLSKILENQEH